MARAKVLCEKCGREISKSNYSKHLRGHENHPEYYDTSKYHLDHDDLFCKFCNKEFNNKNALVQHEIRCKDNPSRINTCVLNFNAKGHTAWNKGLTKETDERILKGAETHKRNCKLGLCKTLKGSDNPSSRAEVREKISATINERVANDAWHTSVAKRMHYNYKGEDLHGTWELKYAQYLDSVGINWVRNKTKFPYKYKDGKIHYYTPDFYLPDENTYIEIKGYKTDKDECKWRDFPSNAHLQIIFEKDLKILGLL